MPRAKGFTLVEVAVAAAAVAILAGLVLPLVLKTSRDARIARARHDLQVIAGAIVSQLKDTGCRPRTAGPGGCDGRGTLLWHSGGLAPRTGPGADAARLDFGGPLAAQTFLNLFTAPNPGARSTQGQGNRLFGLGEPDAQDRFQYRGPYLSDGAAGLTDPWGHAYLVLGYNENGQDNAFPIRVVCLGEAGTLEPRNLGAGAAWDATGLSAENLVVVVQ